MPPAHEMLPRARSPFAAAFLSLLFPGFGQAYVGAYRRALGFAAPVLLVSALIAGFAVRLSPADLAGLALQAWFPVVVFVANLAFLAYRAFAVVDAWSIARQMSRPGVTAPSATGPGLRSGPAPASAALRTAGVVSVAGLAAVLLVMSGVHLAVARYDLLLSGTATCIFEPETKGCSSEPGPSGAAASGAPGEPTLGPTLGPAVTGPVVEPWDGKSRLNILLIGADEQQGAHNTDTMITVSIDPATNQVAMFTLPRDTVDVPVPPGPARDVYGPTYQGKINSFFATARNRADAFPGTEATRGYTGLKAILSELYGIDIKYYVEVNFDGFKKVVDALGGVTVNVQTPVLDNNFPAAAGHRERLFIPAGVQHMTGAEALDYARSRKSTSDFDRGARQQRVLVSLRRQMDVGRILPNIDSLADALKTSVRTDIPRDLVPRLLELAEKADTRSIRSVIFTPPFYQTECLSCPPRGYIIQPNVARIREAIHEAFAVDPLFAQKRDALIEEGAGLWVLNGTGRTGEAARIADYLTYQGLTASAPNQRPDTSGLSSTTVRAYNGAETKFPLSAAALQQIFGVTVTPIADPAVRTDFMIITGRTTPELTPPPLP